MPQERSSKSLSILLVEDDSNLNESIVDSLQSEGYSVSSVDCAEALPEFDSLLKIDLAIIDINLPGENGYSLVRRLRTIQPNIGLIILSAKSNPEDRALGYESGADIYLSKPIHLIELKEALNALFRRMWAEVSIESITPRLDLVRNMLVGGGLEVLLTRKESELLKEWIKVPQNVFSHHQISELLGLDLDDQKQLKELQVSRLRKKLTKAFNEKNSIRSIRGKGYQLCIPLEIV